MSYTETDQLLREEASRKRAQIPEHKVHRDFIKPKAYALAAAIRASIARRPRKKDYLLLLADLDLEMMSARLLVDVVSRAAREPLSVIKFTSVLLNVIRDTVEDDGANRSGALSRDHMKKLSDYREHVMSRNQLVSNTDIRMADVVLLAAGYTQPGSAKLIEGPLSGDFVLANIYRDDVSNRSNKLLSLSDSTAALLYGTPMHTVQRHLPMLIRPRPWTGKFDGGYLNNSTRLVHDRGGRSFEPSQECLDAVNAAQNTRWRINLGALEFAKKYAADFGLDQNVLEAAEQLSNLDGFFQVAYLDFRGRVYQVDELGTRYSGNKPLRGLYEFREGKRLGNGFTALLFYVANLLGQDKLELGARMRWAWENNDRIRAIAKADDEARDLLLALGVKEVTGAVAACQDLVAAIDSGNQADYISHTPIAVDATCSGLQLMALLTGNEDLAKSVNVIGVSDGKDSREQQRQDIYADAGNALSDIIWGEDEAYAWSHFLDAESDRRDLMKVPVMTLPYGSRDMRGYVKGRLKDAPNRDDITKEDVTWLAKAIDEARREVVPAAVELCEQLRSKAPDVDSWELPDGSVVNHRPWKLIAEQVQADVGTITIRTKATGVNIKKQRDGLGPNLIHSLDALLLRRTVLACHHEGVSSFGLVHDSLATHAADAIVLRDCVRKAAATIFDKPLFEEILGSDRDVLDGDEILQSVHFFS